MDKLKKKKRDGVLTHSSKRNLLRGDRSLATGIVLVNIFFFEGDDICLHPPHLEPRYKPHQWGPC